jgi:AAA domain
MKLVLIRGLPGSGKSTLAQTLCYDTEWVHLEADQFWMQGGEYKFDATRLREAHEWCQTSTSVALAKDINVVVSNTFTTVKELRPYFEIAQEFGIVPQVIVAQNDFGSVHNVPAETLAKMRERFQFNIDSLFAEYRPAKVIPIAIDGEDGWHTCPYKMEIHNDFESLCQCSDEQEHECAMDV